MNTKTIFQGLNLDFGRGTGLILVPALHDESFADFPFSSPWKRDSETSFWFSSEQSSNRNIKTLRRLPSHWSLSNYYLICLPLAPPFTNYPSSSPTLSRVLRTSLLLTSDFSPPPPSFIFRQFSTSYLRRSLVSLLHFCYLPPLFFSFFLAPTSTSFWRSPYALRDHNAADGCPRSRWVHRSPSLIIPLY